MLCTNCVTNIHFKNGYMGKIPCSVCGGSEEISQEIKTFICSKFISDGKGNLVFVKKGTSKSSELEAKVVLSIDCITYDRKTCEIVNATDFSLDMSVNQLVLNFIEYEDYEYI